MSYFSPPALSQGGDMKKIYNYLMLLNQQLQYCFSNIDPSDNFSLDAMIRYNETDEMVSQLEIGMDRFIVEFRDKIEETEASIRVMEGNISLKVSSDELCSEISLSQDQISFRTGQLVIDTENFKLYEDGSAEFSGNISGGSININNRFVVSESGRATLDSSTFTENVVCNGLLYTSYMRVGGNADVTGEVSCDRMDVAGIVSCEELYQRSDRRLKEDIHKIPDETALNMVLALRPSVFRFRKSGARSMGFIAQEVEEAKRQLGLDLPMTEEKGGYLSIPYSSYGALYAGAIRRQQELIGRLEQLINERS